MVGATGLTWVGRVTTAGGLGLLGLIAVPGAALAAPLQARADTATVGRAQGVATGNVLSNDIGPDGRPASTSTVGVSLLSRPSNGSAVIAPDGRFTFSPGACSLGVVSFRYLIVDQADSTNTATGTVSVTVGEFASAPLARNDSARVGSNGVVQGNLLGNDCGPGAQASASSVLLSGAISGPSKGVVFIDTSSGTFTYQANAGASGTDSFRYRIANRVNPELASSATVTLRFAVAAPPPSTGNPGGNPGTGHGAGPGTGRPGTGQPGTGSGTGSQSGGLGQIAPPGTGPTGAGGLAAPRPQLPATGASHVLPTALTGFGLVIGGVLAMYAARRRELELTAEPAV